MKREQWSSNVGFLLAAAGSAIGLGNLWKFPYIAGSNGGAVFLILYLILLILLGAMICASAADRNGCGACHQAQCR